MQDTRKKFNVQVLDLLFAKMVPSAGRNVKGPEQLIEVIRSLSEKLTDPVCLTESAHEDLVLLKIAFRDLENKDSGGMVEQVAQALDN